MASPVRLALVATLLAVPAPALAQAAAAPAPASAAAPVAEATLQGRWDMRIEGVSVFRFEIRQNAAGEWSGSWSRPNRFNTDGNNFANLGGGVKTTQSMTAVPAGGGVELAFDDPRPGAVPDIFRFRMISATTAEMTYVGTDLAPYTMVRATAADTFGNWPEGGVSRRGGTGQRATTQPVSPVAPAASGQTILLPPAERRPAPANGIPTVPLPEGPRTVTIGPRVNFLDLTPRTPPADEGGAEQPAAQEAPATAQPAAAAEEPPLQVDGNFLEGL